LLENVEELERGFVEQTGVTPINHVLVVQEALIQREPWLTSELYFLFGEARERGIVEDRATPAEYGLEANARAIDLLARYAHEQGIIPRALTARELFEPY
jgi:4,5-dihydroxyphthalate decarboxylase